MVAAHCPRLETSCPEDNQASRIRVAAGGREAKEDPEALSNRNGEGTIAISPSRTRSKRHLVPHFVMNSLVTLDSHQWDWVFINFRVEERSQDSQLNFQIRKRGSYL